MSDEYERQQPQSKRSKFSFNLDNKKLKKTVSVSHVPYKVKHCYLISILNIRRVTLNIIFLAQRLRNL